MIGSDWRRDRKQELGGVRMKTMTRLVGVLFVAIMVGLLAFAIAGCARGFLPPVARAGDRNTKMVSQALTYASGHACDLETLQCGYQTWQSSGYWRVEDMTEPTLVVVSGDGTACASFGQEVGVPRKGEFHTCMTRWRGRTTH